MSLRLLILALIACFEASPQAPVASPTVEIFGKVIKADTNESVRRATVRIYSPKIQIDRFTDGEGRFRFSGIAPGQYTLVVHRDGYTDGTYQLGKPDFDNPKELRIPLRPQAVVVGTIVDGSALPLQRARVQALGKGTPGSTFEVLMSTETNDLGEYRLSGLDPGKYRLRATYREGQTSPIDRTPLTIATGYYKGPKRHRRSRRRRAL